MELSFNTTKSEAMRISKKNDTSCPEYYLRANVSKGRESSDRTKKSNSILFY